MFNSVATSKNKRRATAPGQYLLLKKPLFLSFSVKIFQFTLTLIGIGIKVHVLFSNISILDFDC